MVVRYVAEAKKNRLCDLVLKKTKTSVKCPAKTAKVCPRLEALRSHRKRARLRMRAACSRERRGTARGGDTSVMVRGCAGGGVYGRGRREPNVFVVATYDRSRDVIYPLIVRLDVIFARFHDNRI